VEPDSGEITVNDADVRQADEVELRRHIGYVMQEGGLMPHWTVRRNVELVPWLIGIPNADAMVSEAMGLVGFTDGSFYRRYPRQLSGGQRQRVAMARALAARPTVLLLDEPFGALDAITRADLQEMFITVRKQRPVTCVLVTHDLFEAQRLSDRIAVMRAGAIEQIGEPGDILGSPATTYVARLVEKAGLHRLDRHA
jgi:osmoprotectant transport system ATP-binding protein